MCGCVYGVAVALLHSPAFKLISVVGNKPSLFCAFPILCTSYLGIRSREEIQKERRVLWGIFIWEERDGRERSRTRDQKVIYSLTMCSNPRIFNLVSKAGPNIRSSSCEPLSATSIVTDWSRTLILARMSPGGDFRRITSM